MEETGTVAAITGNARDGWHGGDDSETGDVGDVTLVEGSTRFGDEDDPVEAVLGPEQCP